ncbi:type IV secretory system conjugative DNA transfer family protein [Marinobacter shengliensis]|uniref:type IV secretory system conjugative DNA transfer family protein n=1 Tax=Marinobacter shengliensis TaxID=1389223 RepID=UPI001108CAD4|nr:type IV secretory system conjugative DNA transfer family protein [Marinobacter shengliensis]
MIRRITFAVILAVTWNTSAASNLERVDAPDDLNDLINLSSDALDSDDDDSQAGVRLRAMRQAAEAVGVQKGYAHRMNEYHSILMKQEDRYDEVFDFRQLMELVPGEYDNEVRLFRLPAVIQEARNYITGDDAFLSATGTHYKILKNTRLTTVPPTWRDYLLTSRDLKANNPARQILPEAGNEEERELWSTHVVRGWERGLGQADQEIQLRIDRFRRDFVGMVRYLRLLEQGLIDPDFVAVQNQMVSGGGDDLALDKTTYQITSPARFNTDHESWRADSLDARESFREIPIEELDYEVFSNDD